MTFPEIRHMLGKLSLPSLEEVCDGTGLTRKERDAIILSIFEHMSVEYIADRLNMSRSTYSRTKHRAMERIRDFLEHKTVNM